jgi:hypothetical protein
MCPSNTAEPFISGLTLRTGFFKAKKMMKKLLTTFLICMWAMTTALAFAGVSPQEAARLGGQELTPMGAERAGNAAGTIPPWTGGITTPPAGYTPEASHPDPYADDKILHTVTAENLAEHEHFLSAGHQALLRAYPETWQFNIYPTHRSASYPDAVYDAVKANATSAQLIVEGKGGVAKATVGPPFPIPQNGVEVVWNHNLRWRGMRISFTDGVAAVTRRGRYGIIYSAVEVAYPYAFPPESPFRSKYPNLMLALRSKVIQPAQLAGEGTLILEPINQTGNPRKVWTYNPNLRRVLRSPFFAYDKSVPNTDNLQTVDELGLYNGPPDRFEWRLLGKRELYVPYNAYRLDSAHVKNDAILQKKHINPDLARYELHRVWVVEGNLKPEMEHVYSRRVFFVDEDSWKILVSESYDLEGNLWRVGEAHPINYYEVPVLDDTIKIFYDLQDRRYLVKGLDNSLRQRRFRNDADPREFSPNALIYYIR